MCVMVVNLPSFPLSTGLQFPDCSTAEPPSDPPVTRVMDKGNTWLYSLDPILLTIIVMSSLGVLLGAVCAGLLLYCTCSYGGLTSRSSTTLENYNFELYDGIKHKVKLNQQRCCSEAWGKQSRRYQVSYDDLKVTQFDSLKRAKPHLLVFLECMSISVGELLNVSNQSHLHGSTAPAKDFVFHWIPLKVEVSAKTEKIARAQPQNKCQHISMFCYSQKMKLYQLRFLPGLVCKMGDLCRLDF